jgi:hypothetical protein
LGSGSQLPDLIVVTARAKPRGQIRDKMSQKAKEEEKDDVLTGYYQIEASKYNIDDIERYDRIYLIKVTIQTVFYSV